MIRRTIAAMLFLALLFAQGAVEQCRVRCALPMAAMAMGNQACDGMDMPSGTVQHQAASCEQHDCRPGSLDAVIEDHHAATDREMQVSSLLPILLWPNGLHHTEPSTGPPGRHTDATPPPDDAGLRLTDSLRV